MNCQNCHELLEQGAAFCGNCGYPVQAPAPVVPQNVTPPTPAIESPQPIQPDAPVDQPPAPVLPPTPTPIAPSAPGVAGVAPGIPSYALTTPKQHAGETPALLAVIFGVIGIVGSGFLIPIVGFAFGIAGLCAGTVASRIARRRLTVIGLIIAALAIVAGFASLVYNAEHDKNTAPNAQTGQSTTSSRVASKLSTPCYTFNLIDQYNVSNSAGSCDATAYNGQSFENSTDIYKIVATKAGSAAAGTFTQLAKQAIDSDVKNNLPGFVISSEGPASFAGSLAYTVYAANKGQDTAVVETGVLHQTTNGYNVFDILHAINGSNVNLQALEAQWQWK